MTILQYFALFIGVPARAMGRDGGYYFDRFGNICGIDDTYKRSWAEWVDWNSLN